MLLELSWDGVVGSELVLCASGGVAQGGGGGVLAAVATNISVYYLTHALNGGTSVL